MFYLMDLPDPPYSQDPKSSHDDGSKPSSDDGKKVDEDPRKESESNDQEKEDNVNSTNNVNAAGINEVNVVGGKTSIELPFDPNMHALEDYSIFDFSRDDEDDGAVADMNNLDTIIKVSPIPTTRIHKDHPLDQVIRDLQSATQTRKMSKKLEEYGFEEPKKVIHALKDLSWIEAMQEELLQFKNKKDESGIVIRNKARLVAQGYTQEEGIDYDEVFAHVARIEAIRLFLAYASFKDFVVYEMDVKSSFLYGKRWKQKKDGIFISQDKYVEEILKKFRFTEVNTASTLMETQNPLLKDEDVSACARHQSKSKVSDLHAVKRIISRWVLSYKELRVSVCGAATTDSSLEDKIVAVKKEVNDEVNALLKNCCYNYNPIDDITIGSRATYGKKSTNPRKGVVIQELGESTTTISSQQSQDKGKGILIEPVKPMKKKDLIRLDEEAALKLQAEFDEEERLAREKVEKEVKRSQYCLD
ncbi:putative ribonuclease H-like domain-containing protein [Tanacetum coccineum]